MSTDWILYGATGYTGRLLAEEAVRRGHKPLLAGRNLPRVQAIAGPLGLEAAAADLDDAPALRKLIEGHALVFHAAGPFRFTSAAMVEACLATHASYLDITGELSVLANVFARDAAAKQAGVSLISAVGFDVVPTDCLARHVAEKVSGATELEIALAAHAAISPGTAKSMLRIFTDGGFVRREALLQRWPLGKGTRKIAFSDHPRWCILAPMGDLETGFHTTGIPNITTYVAVPRALAKTLDVGWPALAASVPLTRRLLGRETLRSRGDRWIDKHVHGADATEREVARSWLWARAASPNGFAEAWLEAPEAYSLTAITGINAVERVLADKPIGALSPASAFGADFILQVPGVRRIDALEGPAATPRT